MTHWRAGGFFRAVQLRINLLSVVMAVPDLWDIVRGPTSSGVGPARAFQTCEETHKRKAMLPPDLECLGNFKKNRNDMPAMLGSSNELMISFDQDHTSDRCPITFARALTPASPNRHVAPTLDSKEGKMTATHIGNRLDKPEDYQQAHQPSRYESSHRGGDFIVDSMDDPVDFDQVLDLYSRAGFSLSESNPTTEVQRSEAQAKAVVNPTAFQHTLQPTTPPSLVFSSFGEQPVFVGNHERRLDNAAKFTWCEERSECFLDGDTQHHLLHSTLYNCLPEKSSSSKDQNLNVLNKSDETHNQLSLKLHHRHHTDLPLHNQDQLVSEPVLVGSHEAEQNLSSSKLQSCVVKAHSPLEDIMQTKIKMRKNLLKGSVEKDIVQALVSPYRDAINNVLPKKPTLFHGSIKFIIDGTSAVQINIKNRYFIRVMNANGQMIEPKRLIQFFETLISWIVLNHEAFLTRMGSPKDHRLDSHREIINWLCDELFTPNHSLPIFAEANRFSDGYKKRTFGPLQRWVMSYLSAIKTSDQACKTATAIIGIWYKNFSRDFWEHKFGHDENFWTSMLKYLHTEIYSIITREYMKHGATFKGFEH